METKTAMKWAFALLVGFGIIALGFRFAGWLLSSFFVLNCLVLIIVVLLQSGKAADLAGAFGGAGSQTAFGPRGAANVLSRATTWCAIMFMVCAMALVLRQDKAIATGSSVLEKVSKPAPPAQTATPGPTQQPATQPGSQQVAPQPTAPQGGSQNPPVTQQPAPQQPSQQPPAQAPASSTKQSPAGSTQKPPALPPPAPAQPKK